jgi:hypothetical protein
MEKDELDALLVEVGPGRYWSPAALGKALNLDNHTRKRLGIHTIRPVDRTLAQLKHERRDRQIAAKAAQRVNAGATPHSQSLQRQQPWKKLGISRATYFRHRRAEARDCDTVSAQ